ncbi:MAG: repressor LexA [Oceanospirillaceae bacterium]|jgi:repressor LexA|uniref:transcriptional repressor LexA n=1 Tax=unclassified Thalassolituus TaxID=2624967 RepID=UPI000B6C735C|nr:MULTISPECIES: transcriptional repressor LexA [unclassified Thalassolituus]MAE33954.1 repressor LexA [Oceanospirillaceae bacterium]OUX66622.1 MAG: repressor LexA [Oceanospirillaceae bacterium TMED276]MBN59184.1 repressor LexA [Oceanospirillaceae bacterium]MDQ4423792.1 transcriptional repressor LexA [Thalassolituus sp.]MDQ4426719.1 transcriptional repressor LexA [Thalassolituus sp.]|tara:strand:+ start:157 stop:756 length:600 start_codon:yes stop_codon:yes gene_type:complete
MEKLTARQQEVLDLIRSAIDETGYPPTRAEIAAELGFRSPNAAEEHLKALARKGAIEMMPGASRGIRIVGEDSPGLPVIGRVAAGEPILAQEHIEDYCEIPPSFFKPEANFLLEVHGDSMIDIGIMDGDYIAVHKAETARNGDIVVARVGDEVTVKRYHKSRNQVTLFAENENYAPIEVNLKEQEFAIEGKYVGVIRRQ